MVAKEKSPAIEPDPFGDFADAGENNEGDDDGFGDFGTFEEAEETTAEVRPPIVEAPVAPAAPSSSMFGDDDPFKEVLAQIGISDNGPLKMSTLFKKEEPKQEEKPEPVAEKPEDLLPSLPQPTE